MSPARFNSSFRQHSDRDPAGSVRSGGVLSQLGEMKLGLWKGQQGMWDRPASFAFSTLSSFWGLGEPNLQLIVNHILNFFKTTPGHARIKHLPRHA